jgi:hypothetical protein
MLPAVGFPVRRLIVITLASLTALGGVAVAMSAIRGATAGRTRFTFSVNPPHQSAIHGGTARFSVSVRRSRAFTGAIGFRIQGLPPGVRSRWQLADRTRTSVVPLAESGAVLSLRVSAGAPIGTWRLTVLATGGGATRTRALALTLKRTELRRFTLKVRPARRIVAQGATATFAVRIARGAGFDGPVSRRMLTLPEGASAVWTPTSLQIATAADQAPGSDRLVLQGTGSVDGREVRRNSVVVLTVVEARRFRIGGDLTTRLYPGAGAPLDLVLTNPNAFDIRVSELTVRVDAATTQPRCSGTTNYAVRQYGGELPLPLDPGSTRLSALASDPSDWPQVSMRDLPIDQGACKGAFLSLRYSGLATR